MSSHPDDPFSPDKFPEEPLRQAHFLYRRALHEDDLDDAERDLRNCLNTLKDIYPGAEIISEDDHKLLYNENDGFEDDKVIDKIKILIKIINKCFNE